MRWCLSIPSAILSAIAHGARRGVLFRGGAALEALAGVKVVALDKTGTLTAGELYNSSRVEAYRGDGGTALRQAGVQPGAVLGSPALARDQAHGPGRETPAPSSRKILFRCRRRGLRADVRPPVNTRWDGFDLVRAFLPVDAAVDRRRRTDDAAAQVFVGGPGLAGTADLPRRAAPGGRRNHAAAATRRAMSARSC